MLAKLANVIEAPTAVLPLMGGEPADRPLDSLLALRRAAAVTDAFAAAVGRAAL